MIFPYSLKERGWRHPRGKQRTDSTQVPAKIRALNRLLCVGETLSQALNCLALVAPQWLLAHSAPEGIDRYGARMDDARLPSGKDERRASLEQTDRAG